jgi:hypothetical protein
MSLFSRLFRRAPPASSQSRHSPAQAATPGAPAGGQAEAAAAAAAAARAEADRKLAVAREEETLKGAIDRRDSETLGQLVLAGTSTRIRQAAAQAVEDPTQIRQLIRDVRGGGDKSVYKILTAKRDALLAHERQQEQLQAEIAAASAAIERHSHRPYDALYTPTLDQLESRWKAVAGNAPPEVSSKVQAAIDRSREVIAQHLRDIAVQASRELAAANAAAEAQRIREAEEKAATEAAAERARIEAEAWKAEAEKREAEAVALRQLGGLIRKALSALQEGSTGRAAGLRRAIEEKRATAPPLPGHLSNQLQQLDQRLEELKDWKTFSVAPKRTELMAEMESLIGATLEPPVLAERIRSLQEEWRTLSKGAGENLEADWQRFREAAQKAYEPCKQYFEAQALVRQENLKNREALLERLAAFESQHDWSQPDWRTVITALRESKQEWRRHSPVERAAGKPLQEKFDAVSASLQSRLDAEYARNVKEKQRLIEAARRLSGLEDSRQAIEEVKALQQQWKEVGLVPRDVDQRLWSEFRGHCDTVFQKRQQQAADFNAALETNKSQGVAVCEELERISGLTGEPLLEGAARVADLRAQFEALGEFPKSDARDLRRRFERAVDRCERAVAREKAEEAERGWTELLDAADRVREYRLAVMRSADTAQQEALRRAAEEAITNGSRWPKGGAETLKKALEQNGAADFAANEAALRKLCIRAEILAEVPTPAEDHPLRREYQVQRLLETMGQGGAGAETHLDALALEWIGVGPVEEPVYGSLVERFRACRRQHLATGQDR